MTGSGQQAGAGRFYRAGMGLALVTAFVTVWTTIVRDDGNGIDFFAVIMAAGVAGFATRFRAAGMARGLFGVAMMQALIGVAVATAPSTVSLPGGVFRIALASGTYMVLWLMSALCFRFAVTRQYRAAAGH